jgi:hypothetical protein
LVRSPQCPTGLSTVPGRSALPVETFARIAVPGLESGRSAVDDVTSPAICRRGAGRVEPTTDEEAVMVVVEAASRLARRIVTGSLDGAGSTPRHRVRADTAARPRRASVSSRTTPAAAASTCAVIVSTSSARPSGRVEHQGTTVDRCMDGGHAHPVAVERDGRLAECVRTPGRWTLHGAVAAWDAQASAR